MELEQLRQLDAIDRCGTISAAAEELRITQPSLSRSIRKLEADLGQELFSRTRNHAELNEVGRLALRYAREILAVEQRMRDAFDEQARLKHTIRIGSVAPAPTWHLAAAVIERYPGTILSPDIVPEREVGRMLFDGSINLAIARKPLALPNVISVPIMVENLSICIPDEHPLADHESVTFAELDGESFLIIEQVGFWMDVCREKMPEARIIVQKDREVFLRQAASSRLLYFTTDAPQNTEVSALEGRAVIPIRDAEAHATFYLLAMTSCSPQVSKIVDLFR